MNPPPAPRMLSAVYARLLVGHLAQACPQALQDLDARQLGWLSAHDALARCTLDEWHQLMDLAERRLGVPDLVPALSAQFQPWHAGLLGFTLMTSHSVNKVAGLLRRLHHLLNDVFVVECGLVDGRFYLRLREASAASSPRLARLSLMTWAQRLRSLTGQPDLRLDAQFQGPAPQDVSPYRRVFGGQVRFDQDDNAMWGCMGYTEMPVVSHDVVSHALLQAQARKLLDSLSCDEDRLIKQLQGLIRARLAMGRLSLEDLAGELGLSSRTLQRRLEAAGLHFRRMVEEVRQDAARQCLRDTDMALVELAASLGFADHASFNRAFKRWTGMSPGAYRRAGGLPHQQGGARD